MNQSLRVIKGTSTGGQFAVHRRAESAVPLSAVDWDHAVVPDTLAEAKKRRSVASEMAVALVSYVDPKWAESKADLKWTKKLLLTVDFRQTHKRFPTSSEENSSEENRLSRWLQRQRHASSSLKSGELKTLGREAILDAILPGWRRTANLQTDPKNILLPDGNSQMPRIEVVSSQVVDAMTGSNPRREVAGTLLLGDSENQPGEPDMFSATKIATVITASAAAMALLAGCTAAPQDAQPAPTAKPAVPVEVIEEAEVTAEQLAADTAAGDTVTAEQAAELNRADLGVRAWKMADGTFVIVREDAVTPDVVVADVEKRAAAAISTVDPAVALLTNGPSSNRDVTADADRFAAEQRRELGKRVMVVYQTFSYDSDENPANASLRWNVRHNVTLQDLTSIRTETLEQAVARAEAFVAGLERPLDWVVIVKP
jgi:hypothetical protein